MTEVLLPPWIVPEVETHEWLDEGSAVFRAAFAPGLAQRQSYGGLRLKLSRRHTVRGEEKAQLLSVLKQTRGAYNVLRTKVHFALRGSGLGSELLSNNTFANGTTGWTPEANTTTLTVADRVMRMNVFGNASDNPSMNQSVTVQQYVPYAARAMVNVVNHFGGALTAGAFINSGIWPPTVAQYAANGLTTVAAVSVASGVASGFYVLVPSTSGFRGIVEIPYTSFARCALVDNGTNALLRSDDLDNAYWTPSAATISANATTAPDGFATAETLVETTATATHFVASSTVTVSGSALDYAFTVALKRFGRDWAWIQLTETTGNTVVFNTFDLANGTVGAATSTGANWSNLRTFIRSLGNGWYACTIVARKTNAATALTVQIAASNADSGSGYTGVVASAIGMWRATLAQSSVPTRLVQTTSAASTGTSQTGNALHLKGLPASTNGLLLPGDWFEINGELKQATAALNSDAAGLGYLQFEPALVRSPANDDPVIVTDPIGKFLVSNIKIENEFGTQARVSYDLEHIYE